MCVGNHGARCFGKSYLKLRYERPEDRLVLENLRRFRSRHGLARPEHVLRDEISRQVLR